MGCVCVYVCGGLCGVACVWVREAPRGHELRGRYVPAGFASFQYFSTPGNEPGTEPRLRL